ncbi:MAG: hypothetical protein ABFD69_08305 [Candidatus Sumerlaeia bacterium]
MRRLITLLSATAVQAMGASLAFGQEDMATQLAVLEGRVDTLQTLMIVLVLALLALAFALGWALRSAGQRPAARPVAARPATPAAAPAAAQPAPAPAPAPAPVAATAPGAIKPEIAAVITAAVTAMLAGRPFAIRGIQPVEPSLAWGRLGRAQIQASHTFTRRHS